jgi:hypothetical protein
MPRKEFVSRRLSHAAFIFLAVQAFSGCSGNGNNGSPEKSIISLATPFADPARDRQVAAIYAAVKQRNAASLTTQQTAIEQNHKSIDPALNLALLLLNPSTSPQPFIEGYPTDARGVMLDYGSRLDTANITPTGHRFPITKLGDLAVKGNPLALTKLLAAFDVADKPIADDYAREIAIVASAIPRETLAAIAALSASQQLDITALSAWCDRRSAILSVSTTNPAEAQVQTALRRHLMSCPAPPHHKKRSHRHKPPHNTHGHKPTHGKHTPKPKPTKHEAPI